MVDIRNFFVGSKSANFYKLKKRLTKKKITQVFSSMSNNKRGNFLLKELKEKYYGYESECSIIIFRTRIEPDFLKNSGLYEDSYAFLLFIEVGGILAIFKKM